MWKDAINGMQWTYLYLLGIGDKLYYFTSPEQQEWLFFWCQDFIHRILSLRSCDTVKYLSDANEGVILYVLPDFRQQWRLVCRNMMRGNKSTELAVLFFIFFFIFAKELCVLANGSSINFSWGHYLFLS